MPHFYTRLINSGVDCSDDGADFETAEKACSAAVVGALDVAKELLAGGERLLHIEIVVSDEVRVVSRRLLTVNIAELEPHDRSLPAQ